MKLDFRYIGWPKMIVHHDHFGPVLFFWKEYVYFSILLNIDLKKYFLFKN
jgi:hypothetical protein